MNDTLKVREVCSKGEFFNVIDKMYLNTWMLSLVTGRKYYAKNLHVVPLKIM